jgi:hypothetical protein
MLSFEDLAELLATPVDLTAPIGDLTDGELAFLGERALAYTGVQSPGIRRFGEELRLAVRREHARRARDAAITRAEFAEITAHRVESGGDTAGIPPWSDAST